MSTDTTTGCSHEIRRPAGPWDALLDRRPRVAAANTVTAADDARDGTKLAALLGDLHERGRATTAELAARNGVTTRQVWGLLKAPRHRGQVRICDGCWELAPEYLGRAVEQAVALLRANGWRVEPPNTVVGAEEQR